MNKEERKLVDQEQDPSTKQFLTRVFALRDHPPKDASELAPFMAQLEAYSPVPVRDAKASETLTAEQREAEEQASYRFAESLTSLASAWMHIGPIEELREKITAAAVRGAKDADDTVRAECALILHVMKTHPRPAPLSPAGQAALDTLLKDSNVKFLMEHELEAIKGQVARAAKPAGGS